MKWVFNLLKTVSGCMALIGLVCAASVDDSAPTWAYTALSSTSVFMLGLVSLAVLDKLSSIKFSAPTWFSIICLWVVQIAEIVVNDNRARKRRHCHRSSNRNNVPRHVM